MKKFCLNAAVFAVVMLSVLAFFDYLSMVGETRVMIANWTDSSYYVNKGASNEIKPYIAKVQTQDGTAKLIIGDSVCHQLFNNLQDCNDDFTIVGSNAAITMAGQYILAKEYLDNHPDATDIFLIVRPGSLGITFSASLGYQYAVMPFIRTGTLQDLDEETIQTMESVYGKFLMKPAIAAAVDLSCMNQRLCYNMIKEYASDYVLQGYFELADQYVYKIYTNCQERGVNFYLYPCPVSESAKEYNNSLVSDFEESLIYEINPEFMESVYYYPDEEFYDGTHFGGIDQEDFNKRIKQAFEGTELVELLNFDSSH